MKTLATAVIALAVGLAGGYAATEMTRPDIDRFAEYLSNHQQQARLLEAQGYFDSAYPIEEMEVGAEGWTVPWAVYEESGQVWINGSYQLFPDPFGTAEMRVWRDEECWRTEETGCVEVGLTARAVGAGIPTACRGRIARPQWIGKRASRACRTCSASPSARGGASS